MSRQQQYSKKLSRTIREDLYITGNDNKENQKQMVQRLCRMSLKQLIDIVEENMKEIEKESSRKKSQQSTSQQSTKNTNLYSTMYSSRESLGSLSPIVYNTLNSYRGVNTDTKGFWKQKKKSYL